MSRKFPARNLEDTLDGLQALLEKTKNLAITDLTLRDEDKLLIAQYLDTANKWVSEAWKVKSRSDELYKATVREQLRLRQQERQERRCRQGSKKQ